MMKRAIFPALLCAAWLGLAGGERAHAATASGTILTNTASLIAKNGATSYPPFFEYEVSYAATATVEVIPPPQLVVTKQVTADGIFRDFFTAGAGSVVTYRICARNDTVTAATNVVLTDLMPVGMTFQSAPLDWTGGNYYTGTAPTLTATWGGSLPPATPDWPGPDTPGAIYLRWAINSIDSFKSVCVTFQAKIQ